MIFGSLVGVATIAGSLTTSVYQLALVLTLFAGMKYYDYEGIKVRRIALCTYSIAYIYTTMITDFCLYT